MCWLVLGMVKWLPAVSLWGFQAGSRDSRKSPCTSQNFKLLLYGPKVNTDASKERLASINNPPYCKVWWHMMSWQFVFQHTFPWLKLVFHTTCTVKWLDNTGSFLSGLHLCPQTNYVDPSDRKLFHLLAHSQTLKTPAEQLSLMWVLYWLTYFYFYPF